MPTNATRRGARLRAFIFAVALFVAAMPLPGSAATLSAGSGLVAPVSVVAEPTAESAAAREAANLLLDRYVHPLDELALLRAGWANLERDAAERKAPAPPLLDGLVGEREADLALLQSAIESYAMRVANVAGFTASHSVIRGMARFVNEGHTYFLDPEQYREHLAWARGDVRYVGIGARMRGPELTVTEVFENSPAQRAGLQAGDVILAVDGTSIAGMTLEQTIPLIRGAVDSMVEIQVRRGEETLVLRARRAEISLDFVSSRLLDDGVAYIALRGFPEPSVALRVEQAITSLTDQGARSMVLDLRGNSGGRLDVGSRLLSSFLEPGTSLYQQIDRSGTRETRASRPRVRTGLPVVILVDGATASMGEIFAAALQEHGVATVLGSTTSGNVAAGQVFPLGDGSALQVTVMEILSAGGNTLNKTGVVPNETVDVDFAAIAPGDDPVLARALEILREAAKPVPVAAPVGRELTILAQ